MNVFNADETTPRNNNNLAPNFQASQSKQDFALISPNNILGERRMRIPTPLNPTRSIISNNQTIGSFNFGNDPPRFGGM